HVAERRRLARLLGELEHGVEASFAAGMHLGRRRHSPSRQSCHRRLPHDQVIRTPPFRSCFAGKKHWFHSPLTSTRRAEVDCMTRVGTLLVVAVLLPSGCSRRAAPPPPPRD